MNPKLSSEAQSMQQEVVSAQTFPLGSESPVEETTDSEGCEAENSVEAANESDSAAADSAEPVIFANLESAVLSTAFSPDGRKIVAGLIGGTLQLFDAISGTSIGKLFQGHENSVYTVAFSPDGKMIASGSRDKTLRLWDLQGNQIGKPFQGHEKSVYTVAFSPDGKAIVSGSADNTLRLWDLQGNQIGKPFQGHGNSVNSIGFSPDGKAIISGGADNTLRLWDLQGNQIGIPFQGHENQVYSVAFSPDGKAIVSGSNDKTLRLWDLQGNQIGKPFQGHEDSVSSVAFSPDGKVIVSGSDDETLRLWDLQGKQIGIPFQGHEDYVRSVGFSPDGKAIISGSADKTLRLWDLQSNQIGKPFQGHQDRVWSVAFSPDGKAIVSGSGDRTLRLWDLQGNQIDKPFQGHRGRVWSVVFSPDGKAIASGSGDSTLRLWDLQGNQIGLPFQGHDGEVYSVAFSPDGKAIVSGSGDSTLRLWDLHGNQIGKPFQGHESYVRSVAFSPDGKAIVSGSDDKTLRLWDLHGKQISKPFQGHDGEVYSVAFSHDGKAIISGSIDKTLRLWDLHGSQIGLPFQEHKGYGNVWSVAFSPDSKAIVSGSDDKTLRLWDLQGNQIGLPFQRHGSSVYSVAFSPDGKTIISGSDDKTLRLWRSPILGIFANPIPNLASRSNQIEVPQNVANDAAQGEDSLSIKDEIDALATVLMLRSLQPPMAVGILGNWGSGKSFGMHLIQKKIEDIRQAKLTPNEAWGEKDVQYPYVGHIYAITFNAWTYAKSDLWASLMQEIFYELNRQISLERQLGKLLSEQQVSKTEQKTTASSPSEAPPTKLKNINRLIYSPYNKLRVSIKKKIGYLQKSLQESWKQIQDLWIFQFVLHIVIFLLIILPFYWLLPIFEKLTDKTFESFIGKIDETKKTQKLHPPIVRAIHELPLHSVLWLKNQFQTYYFPNLKLSDNPWIEKVIEHLLFFLFQGFPDRLEARKRELEKSERDTRFFKEIKLTDNGDSKTDKSQQHFEEVMLEGGDFWSVIYKTNEEERKKFINDHLQLRQFKGKRLDSTTSNDLWHSLDENKEKEQKDLQEQERKLREKEIELKNAETGVKLIPKKTLSALWTPIVKAIANLIFSKEQIENYKKQYDQTAKEYDEVQKALSLLRKVVTSWQGAIAIILMTIAIVITLDKEMQTAIFAAIQTELEQPWIQLLRNQIPSGVQLLTAIAATVTAAIPILKSLSGYLKSVQEAQKNLVEDEQDKADKIAKEVASLKLQVEEQRQRVGITANYSSLIDFVSDRLQTDDYGKRLGLMQQVRQDLVALSDRLTDWEHNRDELQRLFPRGEPRVVLYIDDLDRCPPDRVVEVLESVQLLLNTRLFIVVLGLDDRYVARALEDVYDGVLKRGGKPSGLDYIEKIIQIPYRMRPISSLKVESYFRNQLKVRPSETKPEPVTQKSEPKTLQPAIENLDIETVSETIPEPLVEIAAIAQSLTNNLEPPQNNKPAEIPETSAQIPKDAAIGQSLTNTLEPTPQNNLPTALPDIPPPPPKPITDSALFLETRTKTIEFEKTDFDLVVNCCKHVDITPRTAKRLINIYKILQIIWATRSQKTSKTPTDDDKRIVMSFLALSGRYPEYMRNLFEEIDVLFEETVEEGKPLEIYLDKLLKSIKPSNTQSDRYAQREWRKFTSDITRMLEPKNEPNPPKLKIDRNVFDLMLSFCFVGDIGYDPDDAESKREKI